ncbi:MAG: hypothetical protein OEQ24_11090 [Gammaproteobacteria bacterium]|nr:hypothetical protein [Gammaproteobacteria bacterium]
MDKWDDLNTDAEHPKKFKDHDSEDYNKANQHLEDELEAMSEEQVDIGTNDETMWMSAILWVIIIGFGVYLLWEYII